MAAYNRKALAWFEQHIRIGIEQGEIAADNDPAVTAVILLGVMRGVMLQWLVDPRIPLVAVRYRLLQITDQILRGHGSLGTMRLFSTATARFISAPTRWSGCAARRRPTLRGAADGALSFDDPHPGIARRMR